MTYLAAIALIFATFGIAGLLVVRFKRSPMNCWLCTQCSEFHDEFGKHHRSVPMTAKYLSHKTCAECADKLKLRTPHAR